jgi:hypothetical protein
MPAIRTSKPGPADSLQDDLRRRVVLRLREQDMDVVAHRIDLDNGRIMVFQNPGYVGMKLVALVLAEELVAAFRAEHKMNEDIGKRLRNRISPLQGEWRLHSA